MKDNTLYNIGYASSGVSFTASLGVISMSPELMLTYLSILCMVVSLVSTLILTTIKIVQLVKEKKYADAKKELAQSAQDLAKQVNEINDKIEDTKGEK